MENKKSLLKEVIGVAGSVSVLSMIPIVIVLIKAISHKWTVDYFMVLWMCAGAIALLWFLVGLIAIVEAINKVLPKKAKWWVWAIVITLIYVVTIYCTKDNENELIELLSAIVALGFAGALFMGLVSLPYLLIKKINKKMAELESEACES